MWRILATLKTPLRCPFLATRKARVTHNFSEFDQKVSLYWPTKVAQILKGRSIMLHFLWQTSLWLWQCILRHVYVFVGFEGRLIRSTSSIEDASANEKRMKTKSSDFITFPFRRQHHCLLSLYIYLITIATSPSPTNVYNMNFHQ